MLCAGEGAFPGWTACHFSNGIEPLEDRPKPPARCLWHGCHGSGIPPAAAPSFRGALRLIGVYEIRRSFGRNNSAVVDPRSCELRWRTDKGQTVPGRIRIRATWDYQAREDLSRCGITPSRERRETRRPSDALEGWTGLEPVTTALQAVALPLSYHPMCPASAGRETVMTLTAADFRFAALNSATIASASMLAVIPLSHPIRRSSRAPAPAVFNTTFHQLEILIDVEVDTITYSTLNYILKAVPFCLGNSLDPAKTFAVLFDENVHAAFTKLRHCISPLFCYVVVPLGIEPISPQL